MVTRRAFNAGLGAGLAANVLPKSAGAASYRGPNVVLIRFGGGVRRYETIDETGTYAPYTRKELAKRGVLIPDMRIDKLNGGNTSHAEGTLNLLTGRYNAYRDAGSKFLEDRLEPTEPTLFEYFRRTYDVPSHETLLINGEDRPQEEFFTYGIHGHYGIDFRSEMLSLHRFKLYKFARILEEGGLAEDERLAAEKALGELQAKDARDFVPNQSDPVQNFWARWRAHYGDDGFKNPRGDRLLTELALWSIRDLKPRLMMINYQDPDYVHWGNASHYTRAIHVIDDGIRQVVEALDRDDHYRDNTFIVITPDCGRDANPLMSVPFQHHFNSRAAHEVWALVVGPGVRKNRIHDRTVDQTAVAATLAEVMGLRAERSEGDILSGIFT
ncbi:MAG: sulfatase-like hydrolase/transferase [Rhodobacteraceae bacterium]|nr:sulfatase-like hydrolase/transferase [Paracoccaceae bacterium]